ncbi:hypothetical protein LV178_23680, partial [Burkholderia mallei]|nr:hypothetical protein [Burkholderia mallei]
MRFAQVHGRHLVRKIVVFAVGRRWSGPNVRQPLAVHVGLHGFDPDEIECARIGRVRPAPAQTLAPQPPRPARPRRSRAGREAPRPGA